MGFRDSVEARLGGRLGLALGLVRIAARLRLGFLKNERKRLWSLR